MQQSVRRKSQKQENRIAKELGGKTTPGSGAQWHSKGDVKAENYLIEAKYTDEAHYPLSLPILTKIEKEALRENFRIPVLYVDIQDLKLCVVPEKYITKLNDFNFKKVYSTTSSSVRIHKQGLQDATTKELTHVIVSLKGKCYYVMAPEELDYFCL